LQKENSLKEVELTAARAMLLYALFHYEKQGDFASVFAANKIAYFIQESGEPLKLKFVPHTYGPYAQAVEKVLYALNGKYIKGLEQMDAKPFERLYLVQEKYKEVESYVQNNLSFDQKQRLQSVFKLIEGFESSFSLEILSSVYYLQKENNNLTNHEYFNKIQSWNDLKKNSIKEEYVNLALLHLENFRNKLEIA